ncbi:hypothetical protein D7W82_18760 [Corallococcus sp. CA049B]|uniref:hypothetical protein n=1 Tax=Corallococcus sp. CA049B TaxID=2316730 RepID=UPI000EA2EAD8|nr:hypothetical protein [Corallococcus sp. CA049B]NOJ97738.1 hypothetical protein [Corallococcus coralloides]RKG85725.1 hypothetical protein D7W82_18760 [Corallococcus sp. CA049B]
MAEGLSEAEATRRALEALPEGLRVRWVQEGRGAWVLGCQDSRPNLHAPRGEDVLIQGELWLLGARYVEGAVPRGALRVWLLEGPVRHVLAARVAVGGEDLTLGLGPPGARVPSARVVCQRVEWRPYSVANAAPLAAAFVDLWRGLGRGSRLERLGLEVDGTVEGCARVSPFVEVEPDRKGSRRSPTRHPLPPFVAATADVLRDCRLWLRATAHALTREPPFLREVYLPSGDGEPLALQAKAARESLSALLERRLRWAEGWLSPSSLLELEVSRTVPEGVGAGACWLTARFEQAQTGGTATTVTLVDTPGFSSEVLALLRGWAQATAQGRGAVARGLLPVE